MHGAMPRPSRIAVLDEELGKKDDDHRTPPATTAPRWNSATVPRFRKRRWAAFLLALGAMYLLFKNMPEGMVPMNQRIDIRTPGRFVNGRPLPGQRGGPQNPIGSPPSPAPALAFKPDLKQESAPKRKEDIKSVPKPEDEGAGPLRYYNGEVKFPLLMASLQAVYNGRRYSSLSNVLFVAGNLQSAAILIPMVCEMAKAKRNSVHFAYFGRDDLGLVEIQDINGAKGGCEALWHDARPDHSLYSTDERFLKAVAKGLEHVHAHIHAEAMLTVDHVLEEKAMVDTLRSLAGTQQTSIIEVPPSSTDKLMWLTRLDGKSLAAWHKIDIQVLLQVTKENSGSLYKLLKSISSADYAGHRYPDITFEIPPDLDLPSENVVSQFTWPPPSISGGPVRSQMTIRKRLSHQKTTPLESSIRTVEAFYPNQPIYEHVMVLSPAVELSSMWYHYLLFNVLEYAFSPRSMQHLEAGTLAGISLITPLTKADQQTPFETPVFTKPITFDSYLPEPSTESPNFVPFMWQSPDATATLYFGHKWRELHSFLSLRLGSVGDREYRKMPPNLAPFLEPLNELMQLRGWHVLYPNLPAHHIAIYQPTTATREEFSLTSMNEQSVRDKDDDPYAPIAKTLESGQYSKVEDVKILANVPIHNAIPDKALLPELRYMPVLDSRGNPSSALELLDAANVLRDTFRIQHGGCSPGALPESVVLTAEDLFCDAAGEPLSGNQRSIYGSELDDTPVIDPVAAQLAEEERKDNVLGDATIITDASEEKKKAMQDEFLTHLQRQGSSDIKVDSDGVKGPVSPAPGPAEPEKPAGW